MSRRRRRRRPRRKVVLADESAGKIFVQHKDTSRRRPRNYFYAFSLLQVTCLGTE